MTRLLSWLQNTSTITRRALIRSLSPHERQMLEYDWDLWARPEQLAPDGDWNCWLICAGRGFGKTRSGAEWVRQIARRDNSARIALVASSLAEARAIMVEGESGILACSPPVSRPIFEPSLRRLTWPGGAVATLYSAAEAEGLRGPQHSHAWCDEIAKWPTSGAAATKAWDNLMMGLRLGESPQVLATTTPRPVPLINRLISNAAREGVTITRGSTYDNACNLPLRFIANMTASYGDTALGRQELDGILLNDVEGALWTRSTIENCRETRKDKDPDLGSGSGSGSGPDLGPNSGSGSGEKQGQDQTQDQARLVRVLVGVDPPASANGDECGIIVAGCTQDGHMIVLADCSIARPTPEQWARRAADAAKEWSADRVIAEANQGGLMVESVLRAADIALPVKLVRASIGKCARAEPIAALYEAGRVSHAGQFAALEDQLCGMMVGGEYRNVSGQKSNSPDRADALVWVLSELMQGLRNNPRVSRI